MISGYDIKLVQGTTYRSTVVLQDGSGSRLDLTGYSFVGKARRLFEYGFMPNEQPIEFNISILNPPESGEIEVYIAPDQTEELEAGQYSYDIEQHIGGDVLVFLSGTLTLVKRYSV